MKVMHKNSSYNRPLKASPQFNGFFRLNDSRIRVFNVDGMVSTNELGIKVIASFGDVFENKNAMCLVVPEKPLNIICDDLYDLPIMTKLKKMNVKFNYKKLPLLEDVFGINSNELDRVYKSLPKGSINEFLN